MAQYLLVDYPQWESLLNDKSLLLPSIVLLLKRYEIHEDIVCSNRPKAQCFRSKTTTESKQETITITLKKKKKYFKIYVNRQSLGFQNRMFVVSKN